MDGEVAGVAAPATGLEEGEGGEVEGGVGVDGEVVGGGGRGG